MAREPSFCRFFLLYYNFSKKSTHAVRLPRLCRTDLTASRIIFYLIFIKKYVIIYMVEEYFYIKRKNKEDRNLFPSS